MQIHHIKGIKNAVLLTAFILTGFSASAQKNIAPEATSTASNSNSWNLINDLNLGSCGFRDHQAYVGTGYPPSSTPGVDWMLWEWKAPFRRFDRIIIHHQLKTENVLTGGLIQVWDGKKWVDHHTFTGLSPVCSNTIKFKAVVTSKMRITALEMKGPGQQAYPCFREIEIISAPGANDASIAGLVSPVIFCPGTKDIKVLIQNLGINKINTVKINWTYDGTAHTSQTYTAGLDTIGGNKTDTVTIKLGQKTFNANARHTLKVWTSNVNNASDTINDNDTLTIDIMPSLSGTYTIGGTGADYADISSAAADLDQFGVCGAVKFDVGAGTYNERIHLKPISGASSTNTITFRGGGSASTSIVYTSTLPNDMQTILFDGADYISFEEMTIENKGNTYGTVAHFTNGADYNTISGCDITMSGSTNSSEVTGILGSGSAIQSAFGNSGNYNTFKGNVITGGTHGIAFHGIAANSFVNGNQFLNNTITNHYDIGIRLYRNGDFKVHGNSIGSSRSSNGYGMYWGDVSNFEVTGNKINSTYYGLYISSANTSLYNSAVKTLIANNILNSTDRTPMALSGVANAAVHHNTAHTSNYTYAVQISNPENLDIRNNIFVNSSSPGSRYAFYSSGTSEKIAFLDHNVYYAPNSTYLANMNNTNYPDLILWQKAWPQFNENSLQQDPLFASGTDVHLDTSKTLPYGPMLGYSTDVDGDERCVFAPTIGADESSKGKDLRPSAGITGPDTVYVNSPTDFLGNMTAGVPHTNLWYLDGKFLKDSANVELRLATIGSYTVKVVSVGCQKSDSVIKKIVVANPTKAPSVDILADRNAIDQGETVSFIDLTSGGATKLRWEVFPATMLDENGNPVPTYRYTYGDTFHRAPTIQFLAGGAFRICLTASNAVGSKTVCKNNYISVRPAYTLQADTSFLLRDNAGILFDNGGREDNYANNFSGSVVLDPCADEIYLVFKHFDLQCGRDVVKIYDGVDNTGKALHLCGGGFTGGKSSLCGTACIPGLTDTIVAKSGRMFIEMKSDKTTNYSGFEAHWWSTPKQTSVPVAGFDLSDSVCTADFVAFNNTSKGESLRYFWDFDGDISTFEAGSETPVYSYPSTGTYKVTLITQNCAGADTFSKLITVYSPSAPQVAFTADNRKPTINDIVFFSPVSDECITETRWTFTAKSGSGKAVFMNGTSATDEHPQVVFPDTGCYTVKLWAKNPGGEDSLVENCYIHVKFPYCIPSVDKNIPDIGISYVEVGTLSNTSSQSLEDYQNFVSTKSAFLEAGVEYTLTVKRNSSVDAVTRTAWIDWNQDGDFTDNGERIAEEENSMKTDWAVKFTVPTTAIKGASVLRIAINHGAMTNTPCGPNKYGEFEDYRVYITSDITAPVLTILGDDTVSGEAGYPYTDAGVSAQDNLDGNISSNIKVTEAPTLDLSVPGTYLVHYDVKDAAGNAAQRVTRVVMVTPDLTPPALIVEGKDTIFVAVGESFTQPAALSAIDLVEDDLVNEVIVSGSVDINTVGTYILSYTVADTKGNDITVKRVIIVGDTIAPVLLLNGANPLDHEVLTAFADPGITFSDNYYKSIDLSALLKIASNVNSDVTGTYVITYDLTDPSGNAAVQVSRTVVVKDGTAPVITISGADTVLLDVNNSYKESGVTAHDAYEGKVTVVKGGSFYTKFPDGKANELGFYSIEYSAEDKSGNTDTLTRIVQVVDREAPVITLKGNPSVNICRWDSYTDTGYTMSDNYDHPSNTVTVVRKGSFVSTATGGFFDLWYEATDISGNIGVSEKRYIFVDPDPYACGRSSGISKNTVPEESIRIYPNPNTGKFKVAIDLPQAEQVKVSILNMTGQEIALVSQGLLTNQTFEIDLSSQAGGIYLLQVSTAEHHIIKRIVITK